MLQLYIMIIILIISSWWLFLFYISFYRLSNVSLWLSVSCLRYSK